MAKEREVSRMRKELERGFTLLEMLVVLVIIGVILGFGAPMVMNSVTDSSTQDFVSNASAVESAAQMYYRDEGVMPVVDSSPLTKAQMTPKSILIIRTQLMKAGVTKTAAVTDKLLADGMIRRVDFKKLNPYTKVDSDDEGSKEFVIVGMVEGLDSKPSYGVYENDIAGFVFSDTTRDMSTGVVYSGKYKLSKDKATLAAVDAAETGMGGSALTTATGMTPYGFKVVSIKNNKNGTADVNLSWTNRVVDDAKKELKGYVIEQFQLTCNTCATAQKSQVLNKDTLTTTLTGVPVGKVVLGLQGNIVTYAGAALTGKTKVAFTEGASATGEVDLVDKITNPGDGTVTVSPELDEVVDGTQNESRNDLYKELDESSVFDSTSVKAVPAGLSLTNLVAGDRIVLKELRRTGTSYDFDGNRTRLFIAKSTSAVIPKDPYLQNDFQTNPDSEFEYIVEVYKNMPCAACAGKANPNNAVVVYYE